MKLTQQQIVDRVRTVFIKQEARKSVGNGRGCLYSSEINGFGCAVGCCLPKKIAEKWDELPVGSIREILYEHSDEYNKYFDSGSLYLLETLQEWHDSQMDNDGLSRMESFNKVLSLFPDLK